LVLTTPLDAAAETDAGPKKERLAGRGCVLAEVPAAQEMVPAEWLITPGRQHPVFSGQVFARRVDLLQASKGNMESTGHINAQPSQMKSNQTTPLHVALMPGEAKQCNTTQGKARQGSRRHYTVGLGRQGKARHPKSSIEETTSNTQ
jgi:hypothetical protein